MSASTLTPTIVPAGGGTVPPIEQIGSGTEPGTTFTEYKITQTANPGFRFDHFEYYYTYLDSVTGVTVTEGPISVTNYWFTFIETQDSSSSSYNVRNITLTSVTAYFTALPTTYTINVSASPVAGGHVGGGGSGYEYGYSCTVSAAANQGYFFVGWFESNSKVSTERVYSFTVTGDRDLVAHFHLATNLLINSYSISSPVKLVYSSDTGLLVADY